MNTILLILLILFLPVLLYIVYYYVNIKTSKTKSNSVYYKKMTTIKSNSNVQTNINGIELAGSNLTNIYYCILIYFILNAINYTIQLNIWEDADFENYETLLEYAQQWRAIYEIIEFVILIILLTNIYNAGKNLKEFAQYYKTK